MTDLIERSQEIILDNQSASGGYIASPNFDTYAYCWYRDGAFIAYAMDLYGHHESAGRFHDWAANAIIARADTVMRALDKAEAGEQLSEGDVLHTRYKLDGDDGRDDWPNFQLDGFGAWLWALGEHIRLSERDLSPTWQKAAKLAADYLSALWQRPCYDCWEEFPDKVHGYTLASIHGGLQAYGQLVEEDNEAILQSIHNYLAQELFNQSYFVKFGGTNMVDASLLGLATPFRIVDPADRAMSATVKRIEEQLRSNGGLHRYRQDSYYGGGLWILLSAWLGWYYMEIGAEGKAKGLLRWIEAQADEQGLLPEQVHEDLNQPECLQPWQERWGQSAKPLLWSHAKYLILVDALGG